MAKKILPTLTPQVVVEWHRQMEGFYDCMCLNQLPIGSDLNSIKEAYESDRSSLEGIAQEMTSLTQTDIWPSDD